MLLPLLGLQKLLVILKSILLNALLNHFILLYVESFRTKAVSRFAAPPSFKISHPQQTGINGRPLQSLLLRGFRFRQRGLRRLLALNRHNFSHREYNSLLYRPKSFLCNPPIFLSNDLCNYTFNFQTLVSFLQKTLA